MSRIPLAIVVLGSVLAFVPAGGADTNACVAGQAASGAFSITTMQVSRVLSYNNGTCENGAFLLASEMSGCSAEGVHAIDGALCGPMVATGAQMTCTMTLVGQAPWAVGMFVGFDFDNSYFIDNGETVVGPMSSAGGVYYNVQNPYSSSARLIAYPTNLDGPETSSTVTTMIGCV